MNHYDWNLRQKSYHEEAKVDITDERQVYSTSINSVVTKPNALVFITYTFTSPCYSVLSEVARGEAGKGEHPKLSLNCSREWLNIA